MPLGLPVACMLVLALRGGAGPGLALRGGAGPGLAMNSAMDMTTKGEGAANSSFSSSLLGPGWTAPDQTAAWAAAQASASGKSAV